MFRTFKMVFVLLWILAFLCSCPGPAMASRMDRIDPKNFPNTVWSCRELDMVIYMFEGRKKDICGTFSVNEETYCIDVEYTVNAGGRFKLYSYSEKSVSELDSSLVHYQVSYIGSIDVSWDYQKRTGNLVAKVRGFDESIPETIPETLTFDKVGSFGETPKTRWVAEEYDLYLDSFSDTDKYYSGEITIEGERFHI